MPFRKGKPEGTLILEGGTLRARLIREGDSLNGNRWTKAILEKIVQIAEGVPVNFYDMSKSGDGSFSAHWEQLRTKLPPAIQVTLLPERLPGAKVGVIERPFARDRTRRQSCGRGRMSNFKRIPAGSGGSSTSSKRWAGCSACRSMFHPMHWSRSPRLGAGLNQQASPGSPGSMSSPIPAQAAGSCPYWKAC